MHTNTRTAVAVLLLAVLVPGARAAGPEDVAELFPPDTLAYAELHNPAAAAQQVAALVKGSPLEDSIPFIHKRRDAAKDPRDLLGKPELAALGLLTSPEMLAEAKRFRGVAAGLVGFDTAGNPNVVLAVLTGDSVAAGVVARALLTMDGHVRKVGAIGDVPIYQFRTPNISYTPDGRQQVVNNDKRPTEGPHEPTFAYVPGLLLIGSGKAAMAPVVERYQGKAKGSLRESPAFKEAAASHRQPGLFFFANVPEFCAKYDASLKSRGGSGEPDTYGWFKLVANHRAMRYVAGTVRVRDGGVSVVMGGAFDPAQRSPLLDFLAGTGSKVELLHAAPRPASLAVAVTFPEKDRAAAVIGFLDAVAKSGGGLGRTPSEAVKEIEAKYKVSVTDGLLAKTRAATVVLPAKQDLPKGASALPIVVLHTDGPDVAAAWEAFVPKLVGDLAGGAPPAPATETINGVKVLSLPGTGLPWKAAVHYARKDAAIAVGLDRQLVAAAVQGDAAASVVGGDRAVVVPAGDPPVLLGAVGLGGAIRLLAARTAPQGPVVPIESVRPVPGGNVPLPPEKQKEEEEKAWNAFLGSFDALPPATLTARRTGNELRVELWQPRAGDGGLAPVIGAGLGWFDATLNRGNSGGYPSRRFRGDW